MNWPMAGPKASSQLCYGPPELVAGPLAPLMAGCFWVHGFGDFADGPCQVQTRRGIWKMRDGISISSRLSTLTIVELTCMLLPRDPRHPTVNFNLGEEGAKPVGLRLTRPGRSFAVEGMHLMRPRPTRNEGGSGGQRFRLSGRPFSAWSG
jgi:hypothetical protein